MKHLHDMLMPVLLGVLCIASTIAGCPGRCAAQSAATDEELVVTVGMQELGTAEISAIIRNQDVYLSVSDLFDFLHIKNNISPQYDTLSGFITGTADEYLIEKATNTITYNKKTFTMNTQTLVCTPSGFYLRANSWSEVFGLNCVFRFRDLFVTLTTKRDLPVIREMKQQKLRDNINRLKGEEVADTIVRNKAKAFSVNAADWSVMTTRQQNANTTNVSLSLGGQTAGGETNLQLNYTDGNLDLRNQQFMWHYVNNDHPLLRQVTVGKINSMAIASVLYPLAGVQFTNAPTLNRTAFGTYRLTDITTPGWKVELYINHELIDYQQADASGFFAFNVPIIYGNTTVTLRFYGPWGEVRTEQREIMVPFNFLPGGEMEYTLTSGVVLDGQSSRYAMGVVHYGITKRITVGAGTEYLSSIPGGKPIPFAHAAWRLTDNLIFSGEYAYQVRSKASLFWRLPFDLEVEAMYQRYSSDQHAVKFNYLEERKLSLMLPIRKPNFSLFSRLTVDQITMPPAEQQAPTYEKIPMDIPIPLMKYTTAEWVTSGTIGGVNTNLTTFCNFRKDAPLMAYTTLAQTYRVFSNMFLMPRLQYSYDSHQFTNARVEVERNIRQRTYVRLSVERDFIGQQFLTGLTLRYDFNFAKASMSTVLAGRNSSVSVAAGGSLMYDRASNYLMTSNLGSVGRAQLTVLAFLDLNGNGKRDAGEPKLDGLSIQINGGMSVFSKQDTLYRIFNLEPYRKYLIRVNPDGFSSIAWQLKHTAIGVTALPNQFKPVEIPVTVSGEVSGMVRNDQKQGMSRIRVNILDKDCQTVASVLTESDGYFSYLGLRPGAYTLSLDPAQLQRLHMTAQPAEVTVSIKRNPDGDVVDGLLFKIIPILSSNPSK
ncbi:carboxypeptidase-like regulatory domain-containing protein [Chitinophaga qingshengii]|uniref:Carboxypeptidase regulatory-like domain-containing protein n=1 Tax=Chitinophaga qingshengii TaxID=1569794 RepID=A0ABR7TIF1_9BACT|nr:carboxypeptidase-like regulatory domain-containing protein [Chitinophaga qingshengii]MBC9929174.1 carboxypeptidase regulatory-like domain-containing protein [Chitinophaga qingshengii]